jgi:hypothetical protein
VGAVLRWAVSWEPAGFNVQMAGLIVFLVGILGLVITLILWSTRRRSPGSPGITRVDRVDTVTTAQSYRPDDDAPLPPGSRGF